MSRLPTKDERPDSLHQKYLIKKIVPRRRKGLFGYEDTYGLESVDKDAEYFIMRLDDKAKDKIHVNACRKAVLIYAELIKEHIPNLSEDLIKRYSKEL